MAHNIALIGFGVVGQGLAEILRDRSEALHEGVGFDSKIVAIADTVKGSLYHPDGLDLDQVLQHIKKNGHLHDYPTVPGLQTGWDSFRTIRDSNADTIVEVTFTDVHTGQPAIDHCKAAFTSGKNVVMSNKGPVALAYRELSELARKNGVRLAFEGTVMSGTPSLRMPLVALTGNTINEIRGIFNGTTNYILTKMEADMSFEDALKEAQANGFAEADPTSDIEGYDVLYKVVILANVVMNVPLRKEDVACEGISHLTKDDIQHAISAGKRWKLLARIEKTAHRITAKIGPEMVPLSDPLAGVSGVMNAITYECDLSGPITLVGAGAGRTETGFSLLIDLINIDRGQL